MAKDEQMIRPLGKKMTALRNLRAHVFGIPFTLVNESTSWEFSGQDKLIAAITEHQRTGRGLITVSNHVSLFDDPLVLLALLNIRFPSEDTKCWYSTACADNFNPTGKNLGARVTRYFSEISNIVFLSRAHKRADGQLHEGDPIEAVQARCDDRLRERIERRASSLGLTVVDYIQTFLTPWGQGVSPSRIQTFNQSGLLESCLRVDSGDWVHFFPEGTRSRDMHLRKARPGVGKVLYHATDARVIPICFYGTQDILPVGARLPVPGKTVHVKVGDPIEPSALRHLRRRPDSIDTYQMLSNLAMEHIADLRPEVLARYLGADAAAKLLVEEAQMERAMRTPGTDPARPASAGTNDVEMPREAVSQRAAAGRRPS